MEQNARTIRELISDVTAELIRLNYSALTRHTSYEVPWNRFLSYADEHSEQYFSESLGERYLSEKYQYPQNYSGQLPERVKREVRCIRILGDFRAHNAILRARKRVYKVLPQVFQPLNVLIDEYAEIQNYSKSSVVRMSETLNTFFWYLEGNNVKSLDETTAHHISGYIASKIGYANATVSRDASTLRCILKFLHNKGASVNDLSEIVPKIRRLRNQTLPSYWSRATVENLINSIDRGNPTGKRDYALFLLTARLGIRSGDIMNLKLGDIYWDKQYIEFTQQKTGEILRLPLLDDIAQSIIDYYKDGRPQTSCQNVFVKHCAPYNEFANITHLRRHFTRAGIVVPGQSCGLHSLRHTLASRLLEENIPVLTISEILGHSDIHTTNDYLHIDINNLKKCAIDPEGVFENVRQSSN